MGKPKVQCQFPVGGRQCLNGAVEGAVYCAPHSKKRIVTTPGGQKVFRSGGSLDLGPRLARERDVAVPTDSAGIEGFPYTTERDLEAYRRWKMGYKDALNTNEVLDRYPVSVMDVKGRDMDGKEIAIYDSYGTIWKLAQGEQGSIVLEESTNMEGTKTTLYQTEAGFPFAVISNQSYLMVYLDEELLDNAVVHA